MAGRPAPPSEEYLSPDPYPEQSDEPLAEEEEGGGGELQEAEQQYYDEEEQPLTEQPQEPQQQQEQQVEPEDTQYEQLPSNAEATSVPVSETAEENPFDDAPGAAAAAATV